MERLACDAKVVRIVMAGQVRVLDLGRSREWSVLGCARP